MIFSIYNVAKSLYAGNIREGILNVKNSKEAENLMEKAFEHIDYFEFEEALDIGRGLIKKGFMGGYEVAAEALNGLEKRTEAIALLREGIAKDPSIWSLYDILGVYLSDEGDYRQAHEALEKALTCKNVVKNQVRYNDAVVFLREKEFDKALSICSGITDKKHFLMAAALRMEVYENQKKFDEIIKEAVSIIDQNDATEENAQDMSDIHATLAQAYLSKGERKKAEKHVEYSINIDDRCEKALDLKRELAGIKSDRNKYFFMTVKGDWFLPVEEGEKNPSFYREYDIVAENQQEALAIIREFERKEVRDSIEIREFKDDGPCADEYKGVVWVSGYIFFDEDEAAEEEE